ncbi:dihydrodipicolinate synthase family protein [Flavilitoribacter nigricans]|uniref:Dihydrodipicolinate synthase family protein n=1 Tax=Flavilitoribacter nigricans (strain ATCC 23147 / DSM 23189 / NBRC 102662 / NCIMB 1420 / SS-2) TaxID=1122177 RepID=A0A2D0N213_FLAN2|nr:dihydrodipicolinate synthase family protein [Flavilitoribacter nigricans]PHN02450.1 dihydrodipicolinate synthase family protein [Flavilitoribacter nigricans DSM 23189 = NBRC 102662]
MKEQMQKYRGVIVPMVTPIKANGQIDEGAAIKILANITDAGAFPFVWGTTGEAMSFSVAQRKELMRVVKKYAGEVVTYVGITANSFAETVELANYAHELGYDAVVPHLPTYYPLHDALMTRYFLQLADSTEAPIMLYNIPITTGMSIPLPVIEELSRHPRIVGLKDSEMGEERLQQNLNLWKEREDFAFFLGCAAYSARGMLGGAQGIVPSMANLIPGHYQAIVDYALAGDPEMAILNQQICDDVSSCCQKGRTVVDAIPGLKYMLHLAGYCTPEVAMPMAPPDEANRKLIHRALVPMIEKYNLPVRLQPVAATFA